MSDPAIVEKEALGLSAPQRAVLADRLLESISPVSAKQRELWLEEAQGRLAAYQGGKVEAVDGPAAIAELRDRLKR